MLFLNIIKSKIIGIFGMGSGMLLMLSGGYLKMECFLMGLK